VPLWISVSHPRPGFRQEPGDMKKTGANSPLNKMAKAIILVACFPLYQNLTAQVSGIDTSYFPLSLGNEWTYRARDTFSHKETIADTSRINGLLFYGLSIGGVEPHQWFRQSNDSVFVIEGSKSNPEYMLYDFAADTKDSWDLPPPRFCTYGTRITLVSKEDTVETPAGTFTGCYHLSHQQHCFDAGIYNTWFAKGVGRVRYLEDNFAGMIDYQLDTYVVTSVRTLVAGLSDLSYKLFQNYPNPFNPTTEIRYEIGGIRDQGLGVSDVKLVVHDVLGREVATLVNERAEPGIYQVTFDATGLASGVYYAALRTPEVTLHRKMLFLK
jgi:hypothetical protein